MSGSAYSDEYISEVLQLVAQIPSYINNTNDYSINIEKGDRHSCTLSFSSTNSSEHLDEFLNKVQELDVVGVDVNLEKKSLYANSFESLLQVFDDYAEYCVSSEVSEILCRKFRGIAEDHGYIACDSAFDDAVNPRSSFAIKSGLEVIASYALQTSPSEHRDDALIDVEFKFCNGRHDYSISCNGIDQKSENLAGVVLAGLADILQKNCENLDIDVTYSGHGDGERPVLLCGANPEDFVELLQMCYEELKLFGPEECWIAESFDTMPDIQKKNFEQLQKHFEEHSKVPHLELLPMEMSMSREEMLLKYFTGINASATISILSIEAVIAHEQNRSPKFDDQENASFPLFALH